ncbi:DsbE family thiol:disulfide interchange protein [Xanthomonas massiliensis]|jgi:cytochrome c biogenesis protein CcmG/thiol:disulfide interchange protein DsbE|uniref:DsbE family thiol:disulfide interchange protein n=1 Tax=Xanthomonas massiliensis TaxID=1720302 RepID=UPI0008256C7D|nr:DsbE family thiol:disulfide interchange protein [Xanthomonas massiliensis]
MADTPRRLPTAAWIAGGVLFVALLALLAWGVSRSGRPDRDTLPSALIGKPAPDFALPVLHDPSATLRARDLHGAPYVLNVWGSWCPACAEEHAALSRFALTKRVRVIGYDWKDNPADALAWLEQRGNPYFVVVTDQDGRAALDWGIAAAPETFLVDARGIVRWKYSGALTDQVIAQQLIPLLARTEQEAGIDPWAGQAR